MTADIDLTVLTGFGDEERHVDVLLASLGGRLADARSFALRHRTLLLVTAYRAGMLLCDDILAAFAGAREIGEFDRDLVEFACSGAHVRRRAVLSLGRGCINTVFLRALRIPT